MISAIAFLTSIVVSFILKEFNNNTQESIIINKNLYELYKEQYLLEKYENYIEYVHISNWWGFIYLIITSFLIMPPTYLITEVYKSEKNIALCVILGIVSFFICFYIFGLLMKLNYYFKKKIYPFDSWLEKFKEEHISSLKQQKWGGGISDYEFKQQYDEIIKWGKPIN